MAEDSKIVPKPESKETKALLSKSEVSLWLDHYDDIFSDFDPRPYNQRALSDDFLQEARKATREFQGGLQLRFLIPIAQRNDAHEALIKKRLREHFKKHALLLEKESKELLQNGIALSLLGFVLMSAAAYLAYLESKMFWKTLLIVILEPAGWFTVWFGLDQVFYNRTSKKPELEFNQKMSKCDVLFESY